MSLIINIIWVVLAILIIIFSFYFSFKLKFPQLKIISIIKSLKEEEKGKGVNSFDTLCMSLASKIGVGSLAGIAFAIYYGGIGTIFWIWVFTFIISINSYLENYLAVCYKKKDGKYYKSGPSYYIKYGLNNNTLAYFYAVFLIITYIFGFLTIQNNTITKIVNLTYQVKTETISLIITIISCYFIYKGLKSISNLCNKIVPIMSVVYLLIGIIIFIINIDNFPLFLKDIVTDAFTYKSFINGFLSCLIIGLQKGIFTSEAGLGSGAIASGASFCNSPKKQGYLGIVATYFINFIVTTITAFIIYFSDYKTLTLTNINGIEITNYAFNYHLGHFGEVMLLILILLFAFSTIVTGYYYAESNLKIFTNKLLFINLLKLVTVVILFLGGILNSLVIWKMIDIFLVVLYIINLIAIFKLRKKFK